MARPRGSTGHLTARQAQILNFIRQHTATHGYPPTIREIGAHAGLASTASVHKHVARLVERGLLRRGTPGASRAIVPVDLEAVAA